MTKEELLKQLDGLKAKAALQALSPEAEELDSIRAEIAKQKAKVAENEKRARTAADDDLYERLEAKHAGVELERIDTAAGMIVLRPPSIAKSRHLQQIAIKGKLGPDAINDFVKPCVVWCPGSDEDTLTVSEDDFEGITSRYPLIAATLSSFAQEIGSGAAERRGKAR